MRALAVVFGLAGGIGASFAARLPAVQQRLGLTDGQVGLALVALEAGAVAGLTSAGALTARLGSRRVLRAGFAVYPAGLAGAGLAPGLGWLALDLAAMAAATSLVDVAMNAQGVALERRTGRPLLGRLHAAHSAGVLCGGLGGTLAAAAGVAASAHFALVGAGGLVLGQLTARGPDTRPGGPLLARPSRRLALLGFVAFTAFLMDGAASDWSAIQVSSRGGSGALAAAGFAAFALAMTITRLTGAGPRWGGPAAAAGVLVATAAPVAPVAVAGWALVGAGVAPLAPAVMRAAGPAPADIAGVTTLGYLGSFSGPAAIGGLAALAGLPAALMLIAAAGLAQATALRCGTSASIGSRPGRAR